MSEDTTELSYWVNWKFFSSAAFVFSCMIFGAFLIWKLEGPRKKRSSAADESADRWQGRGGGLVYKDETWKTCLKWINPVWLLAFRIFGFLVLLSLITANLVLDGGGIMYFYTQWTFTLVTIYYALGCSLSLYGICKACKRSGRNCFVDGEREILVLPPGETAGVSSSFKSVNTYGEPHDREIASVWGYAFQIVFQVCGGAVVLTDIMFWFVIYPFLTGDNYKLDFLNGCMHSVNAIFLLGDTFLNCLRFPLFRIGYFALWTGCYLIFQWILHACISLWWPYPFLDFSFPYAPLWYLGVGLLHVPCYGIFALIVRLKSFWLSRSFPESYQGFR